MEKTKLIEMKMTKGYEMRQNVSNEMKHETNELVAQMKQKQVTKCIVKQL